MAKGHSPFPYLRRPFLHGSHNMNYIGYIGELYRHIQKER